MEILEDELNRLRNELGEAQERLDFTERMLAQRPQQGQPRP
jgi:tetrahydromethanopterin S-methyltransferase subunit G